MDNVKSILRKHRNYTLIPILVVLIISAALSSAVNDQDHKITIDKNYLISGIIAFIALTVSFTFFYSGKMNDYKRDYIQKVADLEEIVGKTNRLVNSIKISNTQINKCKQMMDKFYQDLSDPNIRISFTSREVTILSFIVISLIIISVSLLNSPYLDLYDIINAGVIFGSAVMYLSRLWLMYEEILKIYENDLIKLNKFIGILKGMDF